MVLKPQDYSIVDVASPDVWQNDILRRVDIVKFFMTVIGCRKEAITMCLNGSWGTGKTFFLTRLCEQYRRCKDEIDGKEVGGKAIYFNAWEDDDLEDPLVAIVGQIWQNLKGGTFDECITSITACAPKLIKRFAFKTGMGLLKSVPVVGKVVEEVAGDAEAEELSSATENVFVEYGELTKSKHELKERLAELGEKVYLETGRSLLFVIDELDRCRPSFAIETLERVKHLFGVPHIVFLFGVDCEQLKKSVCAVYGDVDASNYLNRFFDLEMSLPPANNEQFLWMLSGSHELSNQSNYTSQVQYLLKNLVPLSEIHSLSLRELEKAERTMTLIAATNLAPGAEVVVLLPILIVLKMRNRKVYEKLADGECEYSTLIDALYGEVSTGDIFDKCANAIRYISMWYTQGNHQAQTALRDTLMKINNADCSLDGIDTSLLPKVFLKVPFYNLKKCVNAAMTAHGYVNAEESLPIIVNALNCIRYG